jgi:hypothetical protein
MLRFALPMLCAATLLIPMTATTGEVRDRQVNQQQRIFDGVEDGTINQSEYRNLQRRETAIEIDHRRALRDGDLSRPEAQRLDQRQDQLSQSIYRNKHDRY